MAAEAEQRRRTLALELISRLIEERDHILKLTEDIGQSSGEFLARVYAEHTEKIAEKVGLFNKNVERVKALNLEMTSLINEWYAFVKDEKALFSLLFPFRLYMRRKQLSKKMKIIRQEISSITIKARLIREDIRRYEGTLEYEATVRLKKDVRFEDYLAHLKMKALLIDELKYLLPTLRNLPAREMHIGKLEEYSILLQQAGQAED